MFKGNNKCHAQSNTASFTKSDFKDAAEYLLLTDESNFKVGLSPSKKILFICFDESPLKMMKNSFYFTLEALFLHKIFKFLSWRFGHVGETAW